jgi:hypothetical protein
MAHKTEFTGMKKLSSGQWEIQITCCGEHVHPHTVGAEAVSTPEKKRETLDWAHKEAAKHHEAAQQLESGLLEAAGETKEHP